MAASMKMSGSSRAAWRRGLFGAALALLAGLAQAEVGLSEIAATKDAGSVWALRSAERLPRYMAESFRYLVRCGKGLRFRSIFPVDRWKHPNLRWPTPPSRCARCSYSPTRSTLARRCTQFSNLLGFK